MIQRDQLLSARLRRRPISSPSAERLVAAPTARRNAPARRRDAPRVIGIVLQLTCAGQRVLTLRPGECASLGRSRGNSVELPGRTVSRRHAVVRWDDADAFPRISNLSFNQTRLDGHSVVRPTELRGGETIEIANHILVAVLVTRLRRHSSA